MSVVPQPDATLYVLSADYDDLYKVGRTTVSLTRRVSQLNTGAARKLTPIASFPVSPAVVCKCEAFVHASLKDLYASDAGGKEFFRCKNANELCERVRCAWEEFSQFSTELQEALTDQTGGKVPQLFDLRRGLVAEAKRLEVRKTLIEDALTTTFNEGFVLGSTPLMSWQKRSFERFDLDAFKKDHPDLAAQYLRTRSTRTPIFH